MLYTKKLPLLIALTLLINISLEAQLYPTKIINMPDHLNFKHNSREPGSILVYKGENKNNDDTFLFITPNHRTKHLTIPKNISATNPIRLCDPKTKETISMGIIETHNNTIKASDASLIEELQDAIAPERILELPESTNTNCSPQINNKNLEKPTTQTFSDQISTDDDNYYDGDDDCTPVNEPTSFAPNNSSWMSYIVGGSAASFLLLGYYYLTTNAALCARYLSRRDLWSSWKHQESYETLLLIDPKYLAKDLIQDIKTTYYQKDNPIELFLRDIEEEYETLLQWMQFRNIAYRFRLALDSDFNDIENRLKLLNRMRRAVHHWRAREMEKNNS